MRIVYVVINADTYSLFASAAGRTQVSCGSSHGPACPLIWMTGNAIKLANRYYNQVRHQTREGQ